MRKVLFFMLTSLDGFFEGPNQDITWHHVDEEFNDFAIQQLQEFDLLLFGRTTYQLMASYWPTDAALKDDPIVAGKMNSIRKIVVSTTLDSVGWDNTRLIKDNVADEISKLKEQPGKDIAIFGSSDLTVSLAKQGLVDEYRIMLNPIVLGSGKRLLEGLDQKLDLKLVKTRTFKNGNVLVYYAPYRS